MDTGHTVVTQGRFTRELLYVSMTRGRAGNHAYVSENDPSDDEPMDQSLKSSWRQILGEVLAAEGAERTAHEVRDMERLKADTLERLSDEYDYLAQIAAAEELTEFLDAHSPGMTTELQQSPAWGPAVAAWRRSVAVSRPSTQRLVLGTLETNAGARDPAAVLHYRLRRFLSGMPASGNGDLAESIRNGRPDLVAMISQVRDRIQQRISHVARAAMMEDTEWKRNLTDRFGPDAVPEDQSMVLRRVAIYRDRWGIEDSPLPLGPVPAPYDSEQQEQHASIDRLLDRVVLPFDGGPQAPGCTNNPGAMPAHNIHAGWQL